MKYINFSDEDFQRANTVDLARYLQSKGERLKKVGSTYQYIYTDGSGTHDSVTISGAKWYDHKNQHGGYAVRFLQEFFGMSFQEAMLEHLGGHISAVTSQKPEMPAAKPFVLPETKKDMRRVFAYSNIEYCCAAGMSFVTTDSKGDLYRNTATIAEKYYGYKVSIIDVRNPTRSSGYNMLYLVNSTWIYIRPAANWNSRRKQKKRKNNRQNDNFGGRKYIKHGAECVLL